MAAAAARARAGALGGAALPGAFGRGKSSMVTGAIL